MARRIEITFETERIMLVRSRARRDWCEACGAEVEMLTPEESADFLDISAETVWRRARAGVFHERTSAEGLVLFCFESLVR
jgi:hypothetical protein